MLSNSQAGPGRKVKQEQEETSRNHVQAFFPGSVEVDVAMSPPLGLFRIEENRDGDTYKSYTLDSYRSTATYAIKLKLRYLGFQNTA